MKIVIEVVKGVEGHALYINNYRIAGPKPWGGGPTVLRWTIEKKRLLENFRNATEGS